MGLLGNVCRPTKNDHDERDLVFPLPPLVPSRKSIHNLPKTTSHQISHHQYDVPGIDPMISPHPRIQCVGPLQKDSHPEPERDHVLVSSRTSISKPSYHPTETTTVTRPNQNVTYVVRESWPPHQGSDSTKRARGTIPTPSMTGG